MCSRDWEGGRDGTATGDAATWKVSPQFGISGSTRTNCPPRPEMKRYRSLDGEEGEWAGESSHCVSYKQKTCFPSHCQGRQRHRHIGVVAVSTERAKLASAQCFQTLVWISSTHPFCVSSTSYPPHIYRNLKSMKSRGCVYNYLKLCIAFPCSLLL